MTLTCYSPAALTGHEAAREATIAATGLLSGTPDPHLASYVARARALIGTRMAALSIVVGDRQHLLASVGVPLGTTSRASSFCGHAVLEPDQPLCVLDTLMDTRFAGNPHVIGEPRLRFYAGAPLRTADGQAMGALCVFDPAPRERLAPWEGAQLQSLAAQAVTFIERRRAA